MGNRKSQGKRPAATERRRSRSGVAANDTSDRGRWSSQRKLDIVLRILRGEDLDALSRELKVSTSRLAQWRDDFLVAGQMGLKSRRPDLRDDDLLRLRAKVGELMMDNELLNMLVDRMEGRDRPPLRRSSL